MLAGDGLDAVADVTVTSNTQGTLTLTYTVINSTNMQLNFMATIFIPFSATVTLSPVNNESCADLVLPEISLFILGESLQ